MERCLTTELNLKSYPKGSVFFEPLDEKIDHLFFSRDEWLMIQSGLTLLRDHRQSSLNDHVNQLNRYEKEGNQGAMRSKMKEIQRLNKKIRELDFLMTDIEAFAGVKGT